LLHAPSPARHQNFGAKSEQWPNRDMHKRLSHNNAIWSFNAFAHKSF